MKKLLLAALLSFAFTSAYAGFGFLIGERISGATKLCIYGYIGHDNAGSEIAYEVKPAQSCPAQIII